MTRTEPGVLCRLQFLLEYLVLRALSALIGLLPERAAARAGVVLGRIGWRVGRHRRRVARENIELAMPGERTPEEIDALAKEVFVQIGLTVVENLWLQARGSKADIPDRLPIAGIDMVRQAMEGGCGVLGFTSHLGNWELLGGSAAVQLERCSALARPANNPYVRRYTARFREGLGMTVLSTRDGVRPMITALRRGDFLGILIDQHVNRAFVPTMFFGRRAATTAVVASLALRFDAPVFLGYSIREGRSFRHRGRFQGPIELVRTGNRDADVEANTQRFTEALEAVIREHPEQWLWTHRRWKLADRLEKNGQSEQANHVG